MPSKEELKMLQALPLEIKVMKTKQRIKEWVDYFGVDGVFVAFSGGKDSTVLLHLVREMYPEVEAVFCNTGLEYPEIQKFAKSFDNVTVLRPKMSFSEVITKYGYPMLSKEIADCVYGARRNTKQEDNYRMKRLKGLITDKNGKKSVFNCEKYMPLTKVDFIISGKCCNIMKKSPAESYAKKTNKRQIIGTMADESVLRKTEWLMHGCNGFDMKKQQSKPMSFWTEQDVLHYIEANNIEIASVYGEIAPEESSCEYEQLAFDNSMVKLKCKG